MKTYDIAKKFYKFCGSCENEKAEDTTSTEDKNREAILSETPPLLPPLRDGTNEGKNCCAHEQDKKTNVSGSYCNKKSSSTNA